MIERSETETNDPDFATPLLECVDDCVRRLRAAGTDLAWVEVKAAAGGLPASVLPSVCAFANTRGGLVILGLSDGLFLPEVVDAPKLAANLASACTDQLVPAVRPEIDIAYVDGSPVVAARVAPLEHTQRPCYIEREGMQRGAYLRVHDGDRRMNAYEAHVMVSGRGQPADDAEPVPGAGIEDLDADLVASLLGRLRQRRGPAFERAADHEILHMVGVLTDPSAAAPVTLAGILSLGRYPQQFYPHLGASFVALPTLDGSPMLDGTRFLDNEPLDGPIPRIVAQAESAFRRNMRRRSVVVGVGRQDIWDYPAEALREIVVNALVHRDYHPSSHGAQVRIEMYPDRIEVASIGGLHGVHAGCTDVAHLVASSVTTSRNARLAKLLEDVVMVPSDRVVCENRGSGLRSVVAALQRSGMHPPRIDDRVSEFVIRMDRLPDQAIGAPSRGAGTRDEAPRAADAQPDASDSADLADSFGIEVGCTDQHSGRFDQVAELLEGGPLGASDIAESLGISRQAVLNWLRRMHAEGLIAPSESRPGTRGTRWGLMP